MTYLTRTLVSILTIVFVSSCATYTEEIHDFGIQNKNTKKIALFLDGTANDRDSRTNISKLFEVVANQNRDNLFLFYNEGVGTGYRAIGAGTGWGLGKDVAEAYRFLATYYTSDSKLYIFGFSRGAYTSRVLAGMLYKVGLYDLSIFDERDRLDVAKDLFFKAYKHNSDEAEIRKIADDIYYQWARLRNITYSKDSLSGKYTPGSNIMITAMGLWDTVEAMGAVPTVEALKDKLNIEKDKLDIVNPNDRYTDQICNIEHALHALSLDDNRVYVFTPIIMTNKHIVNECKNIDLTKRVKEVWFSGAHADVGGGYNDDDGISGISLNWMISELSKIDDVDNESDRLIPRSTVFFQNEFGHIHDAKNGLPIYREENRDKILNKYLGKSEYPLFKIHSSVKDRLARNNFKNGYDSKWYAREPFSKYPDIKSCSLIEWISNTDTQHKVTRSNPDTKQHLSIAPD